jgi:hypothetical protein
MTETQAWVTLILIFILVVRYASTAMTARQLLTALGAT